MASTLDYLGSLAPHPRHGETHRHTHQCIGTVGARVSGMRGAMHRRTRTCKAVAARVSNRTVSGNRSQPQWQPPHAAAVTTCCPHSTRRPWQQTCGSAPPRQRAWCGQRSVTACATQAHQLPEAGRGRMGHALARLPRQATRSTTCGLGHRDRDTGASGKGRHGTPAWKGCMPTGRAPSGDQLVAEASLASARECVSQRACRTHHVHFASHKKGERRAAVPVIYCPTRQSTDQRPGEAGG